MIAMMSKYRVFCTVVELGSFTAAAERLNYSQSAVSQTIKTLEQELGTTLLSRQTHRLQLTRDGESYLPYLQEIAAAEGRLERRKAELSQLQTSELRLWDVYECQQNLSSAAHSGVFRALSRRMLFHAAGGV